MSKWGEIYNQATEENLVFLEAALKFIHKDVLGESLLSVFSAFYSTNDREEVFVNLSTSGSISYIQYECFGIVFNALLDLGKRLLNENKQKDMEL